MRQPRTLPATPLLLAIGLPMLILVIVPLIALLSRATPTVLLAHLTDNLTLAAIRLSLATTAVSLLFIIVFGTPLAWLLARGNFRGRHALEALLEIAIVVPPAVAGVALLMAFGRQGLLGGWLSRVGIEIPFTPVAVVMAQCFVASPYFVRAAAIGLAAVPSELEESANLEGAGAWQVFRHILLPSAWRGFVGGAAMSWARALGEFGATIIFAGNFPGRTQTLPLAVYLGLETSLDRAIILSALLLILSFALLLLIHSLTRTRGV